MDRVRTDQTLLTAVDDARLHRFRFRAMAAQHELLLGDVSAARAERAAKVAIDEVLRIERKYSRYRDDSITAAINRAAGGAAVAIDAETAALLRYADRCHALSDGRFDITSGVLRRVWDFRRQPPRLPASDEIAAARALLGWSRAEWSERSVRLPAAGMEIDFGGIGKEYAADRAAAICRDAGIAHVLVNLGGDVRAIGGRSDGVPWRVGIRDPRRVEAAVATVELVDGAVATSGDYERFFELDGRRYCHLLDPRTGWPVSAWRSASVVAPLAILAGSYASVAMLLEGEAQAFLDRDGVDALLVAIDGTLVQCGATGCFAPSSDTPLTLL